MLFKKGIVRKTFLFSISLTLIVVLIAFLVMYFMLPSYYLKQKRQDLRQNVDTLAESLQLIQSETDCAELIMDFARQNNVSVLSFDQNEMLIPSISSPFLSIMESETLVPSGEPILGMPSGTFMFRIRGDIIDGQAELKNAVRISGDLNGDNMLLVGHVGTTLVNQIYVTGTLQPIDEAKGVILSLLPYVLITAIVIGLFLSGFYAKQITKPILQISDAALKMQKMDPDAVSGIHTNDELERLSENLDALYASLRENIASLQGEMAKVSRLERSKTEMMRNASHELKTPVAALNGMLEGMIDNVGAYRDKEKYLVQCKAQVDRLACLVEEILLASRTDVGEDELELTEVSIDELIEQAIAEHAYQIDEKALRLEQNIPPTVVASNSAILYHALSNLISNAVRYTPQNGEVRIYLVEDEMKRKLIIENESEPILQEELPKLFEPFYTRNDSRDKTVSGTGLGLYIVKRSLERLEIPYEVTSTDFGFQVSLEF